MAVLPKSAVVAAVYCSEFFHCSLQEVLLPQPIQFLTDYDSALMLQIGDSFLLQLGPKVLEAFLAGVNGPVGF